MSRTSFRSGGMKMQVVQSVAVKDQFEVWTILERKVAIVNRVPDGLFQSCGKYLVPR